LDDPYFGFLIVVALLTLHNAILHQEQTSLLVTHNGGLRTKLGWIEITVTEITYCTFK